MKIMKIKLLTTGLILMTFNPFVQTAYAQTTNSIIATQISNAEIDNAVALINSGCANFSDYEKIGLKFTSDDVDIKTLNEQINSYRNIMEKDFSKDELIPIVTSTLNYSKEVINRINSGVHCYEYDYYTVGINLNLYEVDAVTAYCSKNNSSTVPKIKANVQAALSILSRVYSGNASFDDYKSLGLNFSQNDLDMSTLNTCVKNEKIKLERNLSIDDLNRVINKLITN